MQKYRVNYRRFIGLFIVLSAILWTIVGIEEFTLVVVEANIGWVGTLSFLPAQILAQAAVLIGSLLLSLEKEE